MKSTSFEGGLRVPFIARFPGRIPPGQVTAELAGVIDVLPTLCGLAGASLPEGRELDGRDIWPLMTQPGAKSPHEAIYSMSGAQLATIRQGKWKLHVLAPRSGPVYMSPAEAEKWVDPRGPDGVTMIAQYEQPNPSNYPGLREGDPARPMMLFDLEADPGESTDVSASNPEVVRRLKAMFDSMNAQVPEIRREERHGTGGVKRLTGGALEYDRLPERLAP